jgi:hypothetical protein
MHANNDSSASLTGWLARCNPGPKAPARVEIDLSHPLLPPGAPRALFPHALRFSVLSSCGASGAAEESFACAQRPAAARGALGCAAVARREERALVTWRGARV